MSSERQAAIHEALDRTIDVREGEVLAGWVVVYETATGSEDDEPVVGWHIGPAGMTPWRALGLLAWVDQLIGPDEEATDTDDE